MAKAALPSGFRDFTPQEVYKRQFIFATIQKVFEQYGYQPIETPAVENLSTLTEKYGEEGDQLLYRILNSGAFLSDVPENLLQSKNSKEVIPYLSNKGLRYDLTVPFARFVVQHQNEIQFPFKRFQMQPVWRADRPQKGRYREFWQCDADVVGSNSLLYEAEMIMMFDKVFGELGLTKVQLSFNNRKILMGIAEKYGVREQFQDFTVALDKLDKIGYDKVKQEMQARGLNAQMLDEIQEYQLDAEGIENKLNFLSQLFGEDSIGQEGIQDVQKTMEYIESIGTNNLTLDLDFTLARGLDYYTGMIFEAVPEDGSMGSIAGGGRYDELTEFFGLKDVSGIGISFGIERIYDMMETKKLFPDQEQQGTKVLLANFGEAFESFTFAKLQTLRKKGIASEMYPKPAKMGKQFKYADKSGIPYVIVIGSEEKESGEFQLKNMQTGEQDRLTFESIVATLKNDFD